MKKVIILIAGFLLGMIAVNAQSVQMHYNETSNYPEITTGFELFDAGMNKIRNEGQTVRIKKEDIVIQEMRNGVIYEQNPKKDPNCPRADQTTFSAILVCDVSSSMGIKVEGNKTRADVMKEVLTYFVEQFDPLRTEVAITLFAGDAIGHPLDPANRPFQPFTTNKNELKASIKSIPSEPKYAGTNWNAAFLTKLTDIYKKDLSGLYYTEPTVRKYKPVIIFLTDGDHDAKGMVGSFKFMDVRNKAIANNTSIYCIQFSNQPIQLAQNLLDFKELSYIGKQQSDNSDNYWLEQYNSQALKDIYSTILDEAGRLGEPPPCYVTWETHCEGNSATFTFPNHGGVTGVTNFTLAPNILPKLQITPTPYTFRNVPPGGGNQKQTVTLKALQNYVNVEDINVLLDQSKRATGRFKVSDWGVRKPPPIKIEADESYFIEVEYTPDDSNFSEANIDMVSSACDGNRFLMKGEMYPFVENIDFGNVGLGKSETNTITMMFCNKTGVKIKIANIRIDGDDKASFILNGDWQPKGELDTGQCITMTITFKSTEPPGPKKAKVIIRTDYNSDMIFEGQLTANSIGGKSITSTNPGFDSVSCTVPSVKSIIMLVNDGAQVISNISVALDDNTNFSFVAPATTIPVGGEIPVEVTFDPQTMRNNDYLAKLTVTSDAENSPYEIDLRGKMRNIDFTVTNSLAFGEVCVNDPMTKQITVTNTGNVPLAVNNIIAAPFNITETNIPTIAVGGTATVNVEFAPSGDGVISTNLTVSNTECNKDTTCSVSATGVLPKISTDQTNDIIVISTTFGDTGTKIVKVKNESQSPLVVTSINGRDSQLEITNINPALNPKATIPGGGTLEFTVKYTPSSADSLFSYIDIITETCSFVDSLYFIGAPAQAVVDIEIGDFDGLNGLEYTFPVYLKNGNRFDQSGTTSITTSIKYDGDLLEAVGNTPVGPDGSGFYTITLTNNSIDPFNLTPPIFNVKFLVNQKNNVLSTVLDIMNTTANVGAASFNELDGSFTLNPVSPNIYIDSTISAEPGEETFITIVMKDTINVSSAVKGFIEVDMYFDGTILQPLNSALVKTKNYNKVTKQWHLTLALPKTTTGNDILAKIPVLAKLGMVSECPVTIDTSSATSLIKTSLPGATIHQGKFTLKGICEDEDGTKRLFDPYEGKPALLFVNPNPSDGNITINYNILEEGQTKIWVCDLLGSTVLELYNNIPRQGEADLSFDGTRLPNGVYFVIMQTPTQIFRKQIYIAR